AASDDRELLEADVSSLESGVLTSAAENASAELSESSHPDAGEHAVQEFASAPSSDAERLTERGFKEGENKKPVPPAEPSLDVPAPVLPSPEISLSAAAFSEAQPETIQ